MSKLKYVRKGFWKSDPYIDRIDGGYIRIIFRKKPLKGWKVLFLDEYTGVGGYRELYIIKQVLFYDFIEEPDLSNFLTEYLIPLAIEQHPNEAVSETWNMEIQNRRLSNQIKKIEEELDSFDISSYL